MSDNSLFSKHMRLIENAESTWSAEDRTEFERLQKLELPRLELKPSRWQEWKSQIQLSLGAMVMASLVLFVTTTLKKEDTYRAKGSLQVSVIWERGGKVAKLSEESVLQDGDKVGASVISSEEAVAYWTITDSNMKVLNSAEDIESSKLLLEPGVSKSFASSFELTAPNQGENLVVAVCPKSSSSATSKNTEEKKTVDSIFDRQLVTQLLTESQVRSTECVFVGYRLRKLP